MKTLTVYSYSELPEEAKETAKKDLFETITDVRNEDFYSCIKTDLSVLFPDSKLDVEYSLSYCQGDGLNIYGKMDLNNLFTFVCDRSKTAYTEKEKRRLSFYCDYYNHCKLYEMKSNRHYTYFVQNADDLYYDIMDILESDCLRDIDRKLIDKFCDDAVDALEKYCKELEDNGYEYLYKDDFNECELEWIDDCFSFTKDGIRVRC